MEDRKCSSCTNVFPLTEEFFYKTNHGKGYFNFMTECKICNRERRKYNYALKKAKEEKAKEDSWLDEHKNKLHLCKWCGEEKALSEMRINRSKKQIEARCKKCYNKRDKEMYRPNHEANIFAKVLEERRRDKNGEKNAF